jgi:hypothetical protein
MSTSNNNGDLELIKDRWAENFSGSINSGNALPVDIRKQHYQDFTNEDFHYLYEIVTSIIDTLSSNGIDVNLGQPENRQIKHRKAVKERFPK